jgi:CHASE2 domain
VRNSPIPEWRDHLPAALLSTLALALLLNVAEHLHWFNWADVVTLQIAGAQGKQSDSEKKSTELAKGLPVAIVKIGDEAFEKIFNEQSPLSKERLVEIIQAIAQSRPKVLVLDIDITPTAQEAAANGIAPRLIDQTLASLASTGVSVILPLSLSASQAEGKVLSLNLVSRFDWVKRMCNAGVSFASPEVLSHLGTVTKLRKTTNAANFISLSELAYLQYRGGSSPNMCSGVLQQPDVLRYLALQKTWAAQGGEKLEPINMRALSETFLGQISTELIPGDVGVKPSIRFSKEIPRGGIVMLGGAYGGIDQHLTPRGDVYGLELHGALVASHARPVGDISWYVSLIVELITGTLIGFLFMVLWWVYDQFGAWYKRHFDKFIEKHSEISVLSRLLALVKLTVRRLMPLACLLVVCAVPFLITYIALSALQTLIDSERWINPAPFIFGLFLHSILVRVEGLQDKVNLQDKVKRLKLGMPEIHENHENHSMGVFAKLKHHFLEELGAVIVIVVAAIILFIQLSSGSH